MSSATLTALPVLDISRMNAGEAERAAFLDDLRRTAHEIGFFYVGGHGISQSLITEMLTLSRRFFNLPDADKLDLFRRGAESALRFLEGFDWTRYKDTRAKLAEAQGAAARPQVLDT